MFLYCSAVLVLNGVRVMEKNDLISREDLIKKIFPYGMPDDGNYPINAKAVMKAILEVKAVGKK